MSAGEAVRIADAEARTGVTRETLRIWERRYGYPTPARDAAGNRIYASDQIEALGLLRRLVDLGERAGTVVGLPLEALQHRLRQRLPARSGPPPGRSDRVDAALARLRDHDGGGLVRLLTEVKLKQGLPALIALAAELCTAVGDEWAAGRLHVFEEHLFTDGLVGVLRQCRDELDPPEPSTPPRVLFTTLPCEAHGIGLALAELTLRLQGASCQSLGLQTPPGEIRRACLGGLGDVVALSFAACASARAARQALRELLSVLPAGVEVWVGGRGADAFDDLPGHCHRLELSDLPQALARWRATAPAASGRSKEVATPATGIR